MEDLVMESLSSNFQYKGLNAPGTDNEDEDFPPEFTTLAHEQEKSKWSHIDDLDDFFTRVYQYHQNHGIFALVFSEILNLFQILFLAGFSIFMIDCVDYKTLFQSQKVVNNSFNNDSVVKKNTINDVVFPLSQCVKRITFWNWVIISIVVIFWLFRLIRAIYIIARYAEIRSFFINALNIQSKDLPNITWHEVQERLLQLQKKYHLCVHKQELTELDLYNRILRFKNYEVAMTNQGLLPPKINVPFFGQIISLSSAFKLNFEFLFFWGPFSPFRNYQLRHEFKVLSKRSDLTAELKKIILIIGILNLILAPVIFVWQLLQFVYSYAELIKRDPSMLGIRRWSNYGKLYFRHFNELDHELDARLSRAYKPSMLYLSSFQNSKFIIVVAKFFLFIFGAIFAVLVGLTVWDEDVINVEHVFAIMTMSGAIAGIARSLIPDESAVYFMDQMMYQILAQVHYMPDAWKQHANTYEVREEFVKLFQFKFVYLLEELFSPIITPFVLLFWLRPRSVKIVDFLRNFTVDVVGVGDVCSFAQMDTRRHGNVRWLSKTNAKKSFQARNGKTELSLIHFVHTNPNWKAPVDALAFIDELRDQALRESVTVNNVYGDHMINSVLPNISNQKNNNTTTDSMQFNPYQQQETSSTAPGPSSSSAPNNQTSINQNSLNKSLYHLQSLVYNPAIQSNLLKSHNYFTPMPLPDVQIQQQQSFGQMPRGAVSRIEGPLFTNKQEKQTLLTIAQASTLQLSSQNLFPVPAPSITTALDNSLDMCFSALYMHELHRKYNHGDYIDLDNVREENEEADNEQPETSDYYLSQKRPLLGKSVVQYKPNSFADEEEGNMSDHNDTLTNKNNYDNAFNNNRMELKNEVKPPFSMSNNNNNSKI